MRRLQEKKIDDAKYYERIWSEEHNKRPYYDAVRMRALIEPVKVGDRVLDVGAGVFGAVQYLAEEHQDWIYCDSGCSLVCIDQSYTAKEIVDKKKLGINYIIGEVDKLPFEDGSFDVVTAGEIIEHMEDPAAFAKELARVCRAGGTIVMSTVDTHCENAIKHGEYEEHIWEFEPDDLIKFFEPYGDTRYYTVGDYHFISCRRR